MIGSLSLMAPTFGLFVFVIAGLIVRTLSILFLETLALTISSITCPSCTVTKNICERYAISAMIVEETITLFSENKSFCNKRIMTTKTIDVIANVKGLINELILLTAMLLFV